VGVLPCSGFAIFREPPYPPLNPPPTPPHPFPTYPPNPNPTAHQLSSPDYRAFLDFMCPPDYYNPGSSGSTPDSTSTSTTSSSSSRGSPTSSSTKGRPTGSTPAPSFPPDGSDPTACPRPVLGVYDDHDSGWNNGDGRNPQKHAIKVGRSVVWGGGPHKGWGLGWDRMGYGWGELPLSCCCPMQTSAQQ